MKPIDGDLNPTHLLAHDRYLLRLVRSLLVDEHEVDDVLQQTWMSAIEGGPSRPAALRGWLARVARNFALKRRRAEGRRQAHTEAAARPERIPSTVDVLAREAARKSVVDAVLTLAEPYRSTTILRYLEGQPPREVAKRLGVPVETVRTRVRHALGLLRAELDRRNGGDREAWCVALLPLCALEKSSAVGAAAPLKATVAAGVFMATKLKIAIAAIVLVLVALAMWHWTGRPGSRVVGSGNSQHEVASSSARPAGAAARPDLPAAGDASIAPAVTANSSTHETGLVVHLTWESDQTPAAGVGLRIVPADIADGFLDTRWATTDASGTARVSGLPAGAVDIYQDRGYAVVRAAIVSGATTETTMKAAAGVDVEGMVVDAADRPVDGAEIWVYPDSDDLLWGQPVTRSKSDGTFQIHAVARKAYIGARSPSHSPSEFVPVFTERGVRTTNMRLVLPGRGGEIVGRVCGPDGEPVAGALVRQLQLPLGSLGLPLVGDAPDAEYAAAIAQWWASLAEQHRTPTDVLATLAAPVL
ncbi:MAG: sigma-70 family RNA polymerase sigma factor, partial [Planctomycetes bacterium]|nr:sigma-70 family RNA polymerase sigma factor [Planctomycetota bacterium]